jgi:hypothetical protein
MRQLDDFFSRPVDRVLYHYTGIGGLLGIVNSRKLWAGDAFYLNDSQEIFYGCDILRRVAPEFIERADPDEAEFIAQLLRWLGTFEYIGWHIFLFGLSEQASLLSQWRSYTPHGKGVSIGFAPARIQHVLQTSNVRIAKCIYEEPEQAELMRLMLDRMLTTYRQRGWRPQFPGAKADSFQHFAFLEGFRADLLQVLAIIKHPAFKEGREWRVIPPCFPNKPIAEVQVREGASMLVPYIALDLAQVGDANPLFEEVILGPSQHAKLSAAALSDFLYRKNACKSIKNCDIPYREW